jgi:hypothetical protein
MNPCKMLFCRFFSFRFRFVRHWDQWETGKHSHLFKLDVKQQDGVWYASDQPTDIMQGMMANSPTSPFGGFEQVGLCKFLILLKNLNLDRMIFPVEFTLAI